MGQAARFQETLRRLTLIDEGLVEDQAGLRLDPAADSVLDGRTVALVRVAALVAIGSPAVCLEWSAGRALAAGATEDEIADVLLAIAPVAGLGRVVTAAPDLAIALGLTSKRHLRQWTIPNHPEYAGRWPRTPDQRMWRGKSAKLTIVNQDSPLTLTRNSQVLTAPPTRLATAAGINQYKPPPALARKVSPARPTSTAVVTFGENLFDVAGHGLIAPTASSPVQDDQGRTRDRGQR
jgi:alkylhydroperoxidase/carboxymuconolactone decarboxylase family protein YurZ